MNNENTSTYTATYIKDKDEIEKIDGTSDTHEIKNTKLASLPSTGGMGTTIFYAVGSILVLGAAIILIAKKRANVEK